MQNVWQIQEKHSIQTDKDAGGRRKVMERLATGRDEGKWDMTYKRGERHRNAREKKKKRGTAKT